MGKPGGADGVAVIGRGGGDVNLLEAVAADDFAVEGGVERAAAGEHEVLRRAERRGLGEQRLHHLGEDVLAAAREVGPALVERIGRAAGEDLVGDALDRGRVGEAELGALDAIELAQQREQLGIALAIGREPHDLPLLALGLVEAGKVGDEAEIEADRFAAAMALQLGEAAVLEREDGGGAGLAHAVDDEAGGIAEGRRPGSVGGMAEMVAVALHPGDLGLAEGAVEAEHGAEAGALLLMVQVGDQGALAALGHERTIEGGRELEQGIDAEGAGAAHLVEEAGEFLAPAGGEPDFGAFRDVALEQAFHPHSRVRLAVRCALVLQIALGRLGEEDLSAGIDDGDGRVVEGGGEADGVAHGRQRMEQPAGHGKCCRSVTLATASPVTERRRCCRRSP